MPIELEVDYKSLFNTLPAGYIAFLPDDPNFTIIAENETHASIAMVNSKETIGKPLFEAFPDKSLKYKKTGVSDLRESLRRVIATKLPDTIPTLRYDLEDKTGTTLTKYWTVTHYPVFDKKGDIQIIYQATEDITASQLAKSKLEATQQQLDEALSVGLIATWLWDVQADVMVGDKNLAMMFGLSETETTKGFDLSVFTNSIYQADRRRVTKEISNALRSEDSFVSEYRTLSPDGRMLWVIARGRIERDETGRAVSLPGVLVDITERKQVENNLRFLASASNELSSSLDYKRTLTRIAKLMVPTIADWAAIQILDEDNVLQQVAVAHKDPAKVKWAKALREKQGPQSMDEPSGVPQVIRSGKSEFYPYIPEELIVQSAKSEEELKLLRSLGLKSIIIVPLKVSNKAVGAITLVLSDQNRHYSQSDLEMAEELASRASFAMSNARLYDDAQRELAERIRLEKELKEANQELERRVEERTAELEETNLNLERSNQELQDFAYVASHDLQEPLRKIQAFGNLLQVEYADKLGEGGDYLTRMRNAAARMSALIEDILSFSRVTTKGRTFSDVSLSKVVDEVLGDLEIRIEDTHAKIRIGSLPVIHADPMQMRQLFQNLISNALKFHQAGKAPLVEINATVEKSKDDKIKYCKLEIRDNGLGFDEKYLDRIFAVFQRLHNREVYKGTGIGLAVCRKIVERHGGTITARSKPGKGSTFIITLPLRHKKGEQLL